MFLRAFRHRGTIKKVGQRLLRPVLYGFLTFIAALIVWKFVLGILHYAGLFADPPGLRWQFLVPLAAGMTVLTYRLIRDLLPEKPEP
jgi:hypothetical protein